MRGNFWLFLGGGWDVEHLEAGLSFPTVAGVGGGEGEGKQQIGATAFQDKKT